LLHVLALARVAAGDRREAWNALLAAVAQAPQDVAIRLALGAVCLDLGRPAEAQRHLEAALAAGAESAEAYDNLGLALRRQRKLPEAIEAFARAVSIAPRLTPARANLLLALREACDWPRMGRAEAELLVLLGDPGADPRCPPYVTLLSIAHPAQQCEMIRRWSAARLPAATPGTTSVNARTIRSAPATIATRGTRLRVGYLSSDLHDHATARLTAGLFERHDGRRFEVYAYSHGPDDGSALRRRLQRAFEHWVDLAALDDEAAAHRISADGIDVLVDLKGHTDGARPGILARRPAPLQIHYLGFPGTIGLDDVDALVADPIVVPEGDDAHYAERVIRLPRCYQVNDRDRLLPAASGRASLGLPEQAVVLACFNAPHKLSPGFFRAWLAALTACDDAVLWLYAPHPTTRAHLIGEAAQAGLAAERIVFAPAADHAEHIARLRAADLALDLLPYGSHTTGSDALWAGVPMLSATGATFAGRVGASLLQAVALEELVAGSLADYVETLVTLVRDHERLHAYRDHLERSRLELPLFDTEAFTRDWERMLESEVG
jgi:predicted O-linked N-acetylglucosamine transferase (SPINDLY family)